MLMLMLMLLIKLMLMMCNVSSMAIKMDIVFLTRVITHSSEDVIFTHEMYQFAEMHASICCFASSSVKNQVTCAFIVKRMLSCLSLFSCMDRYVTCETAKTIGVFCYADFVYYAFMIIFSVTVYSLRLLYCYSTHIFWLIRFNCQDY